MKTYVIMSGSDPVRVFTVGEPVDESGPKFDKLVVLCEHLSLGLVPVNRDEVNSLEDVRKILTESHDVRGWDHFGEPLEIERVDELELCKDDDEAAVVHRKECGCPWPEMDYQHRFASDIWDTGAAHEGPASPQWPSELGEALRLKVRRLYEDAAERAAWKEREFRDAIVARTLAIHTELMVAPVDETPEHRTAREKVAKLFEYAWSILMRFSQDLVEGHANPKYAFSEAEDWATCGKCGRGYLTEEGHTCLRALMSDISEEKKS